MSPGTGSGTEQAAEDGRLTIGSVLAALADDFPGLSISKIRFLEAEGLLTPERTASGYRTYSTADVERLRYILVAQRQRFWPLKVIRDALDALDRGLQPVGPDGEADRPQVPQREDPAAPWAADLRRPQDLRLTAAEVREAAGLDGPTFESLVTYGLVHPDPAGHFGEADLAVARAAGELSAYGIEPRHLRPFRTAADREIGLVQQAVRPHLSRNAGRVETQDGGPDDPTAQVLSHCVALHLALVRAGLSRS